MPLKVKTANSNVYGRCGLVFGPEPKVVDDATLEKKTRRNDVEQTVRERLLADPYLVCEEVVPEAAPPEGDDAEGKRKPKK